MALSIDDAGTIAGSLGDGGTPYVWTANGKGHALKVPSDRHGGKVFVSSTSSLALTVTPESIRPGFRPTATPRSVRLTDRQRQSRVRTGR
jgi:hypothetical protein